MPNFVFLWTDIALYLMVLAVIFYAWRVSRSETARATWGRVARSAPAMSSAVVLLFFVVVGLLDSVHFQPRLPPAPDASPDAAVVYSPQVVSLLDTLLDDTALTHQEKTYSAPLAYRQFTKETILQEGGETYRDFPRLRFGGKHLDDPEAQWLADVSQRASLGLAGGLATAAILLAIVLALITRSRRRRGQSIQSMPWTQVASEIARGQSDIPWRAMLVTMIVMCLVMGVVFGLATGYHVMGTDQTGNDVLWRALKSVRTAWVIGTLTTVAMLPPALIFGLAAGYFKGWVDDVIQYIYTTLTAIPGVLLIAAAVLMMQVYIDTHPDLFPTSANSSRS